MTSAILALWHWRSQPALWSAHWRPLAIFALVAAGLNGPLIISLLLANARDPFLGGHASQTYSADVLSFFSYSPGLRWSAATQAIWSHLRGAEMEGNIYLGMTVLAAIVASFVWRRRPAKTVAVWQITLLIFAVLALGPRLHIWGRLTTVALPYAVLEWLMPSLRLSGVPARHDVMVMLAAGVLTAMVLSRMSPRRRWLMAPFAIGLALEFWPSAPFLTDASYPAYATALARLPVGAVVDLSRENQNRILYAQTRHGHPLAFGSISRTPQSVQAQSDAIWAAINRGDWAHVCQTFHFTYVVAPLTRPVAGETVFADAAVKIVCLGRSC